MDENSVSSQIFLILLSVITPLVQNVQLNFCIQAMSKQYSDVCCFLLFLGGGVGEIVVFSVKKNLIRHFARFNFSRLSLAFILKYYLILHVA